MPALRKLSKGLRLFADRRFRRGLLRGVAATLEHEFVLEPFRFDTVVDVGANRGQFTLLMAGLRPGADIYAFEPLTSPYRKLVDVTSALKGVRAFNTAIGPVRGSVSMNVAKRDDSSSLLPIGELQETMFPNTGLDHVVDVRIAPLGDYLDGVELRRPSLLKIDVQGYELQVLKGSLDCLHLFDVIYVEASFLELYQGQPLAGEVITALGAMGFRLTGILNLHRSGDGQPVQADFLFER